MESYAAGETTPPLLEQTIGDHFERMVAVHGDREALVEVATGRRWTYAELDADVNALARGLMAAGVAKGDRVGIWAPNCAEWTLVQYATAKIGAIVVNVNPAYRTHELAYALNQSGLQAAGQRRVVQEQRLPGDGRRGLEGHPRAGAGRLHRHAGLGRARRRRRATSPEKALPDRMGVLEPGDPINIQYTSGTTGYPKGATL